MSITLGISTLGSSVVGVAYYYLAPKFSTLSSLAVNTQVKALGISTVIQGFFHCRDEYNTEEKSVYENIFRYSVPYILIGGGSIYADRTISKVTLLSTVLLGTAQFVVGRVSSSFVDNWVNSSKFGAEAWKEYFGDVGLEPDLPENIEEILNEPCPFWHNKKVKDTHTLTLIPATINGEPFTLDLLSQIIKNPKKGHKSEFFEPDYNSIKEQIGKNPNPRAYWVLMTKYTLYGENKGYEQSILLINKQNYKAPSVLEAATSIIAHYTRRGEYLYYPAELDDPKTCNTFFTYCSETLEPNKNQVIVGAFHDKRLIIRPYDADESDNGTSVSAVRILD